MLSGQNVKLERLQRVQCVRALLSTSLLHSSSEQLRMKIKPKEKNNASINTSPTQTNTQLLSLVSQNVHVSYSNADKRYQGEAHSMTNGCDEIMSGHWRWMLTFGSGGTGVVKESRKGVDSRY